MQNQITEIQQKLIQTIEKNCILLEEKKYYEFAQKIKLLSHRKSQTNKHEESQILLRQGAKKLLSIEEVQVNIPNELIISLLQIYQTHQQIWSAEKASIFYRLMNIRQNSQKIKFYIIILKKISKIEDCSEIAEQLISFYQNNKEFVKAQSHVILLDLSRVNVFLQKWRKCVNEEQFEAIRCRVALLKGIFTDFDESMVILSDVPVNNAYYKFSKCLILSIQLKSRDSFEQIGSCYKTFLEKDMMFKKIYETYGVYFFKKQIQGPKGLKGLLSSFE